MTAVRIATNAITRDGLRAKQGDKIIAGVHVPWIELDGHQFVTDSLMSINADAVPASVTTEEGMMIATLRFAGPIELVFLDADGEPMSGICAISAPSGMRLDGTTSIVEFEP